MRVMLRSNAPTHERGYDTQTAHWLVLEHIPKSSRRNHKPRQPQIHVCVFRLRLCGIFVASRICVPLRLFEQPIYSFFVSLIYPHIYAVLLETLPGSIPAGTTTELSTFCGRFGVPISRTPQ